MRSLISYRDLFAPYLDPPDAYDCGIWAFGDEIEEMQYLSIPSRWNNRHESLFKLEGVSFKADIAKIVDAWLNEKERKKDSRRDPKQASQGRGKI